MYNGVILKYIISGNVEYYTDLWSTLLFWSSLPVFFLSETAAQSMMLAAFALLAIRLINNKLIMGKWFC